MRASFATPLIIFLCLGWAWSELRNKTKDDYIQTVLQDNSALQLRYDDEHWKAVAQDSAMAKDARQNLIHKAIIDSAVIRHK